MIFRMIPPFLESSLGSVFRSHFYRLTYNLQSLFYLEVFIISYAMIKVSVATFSGKAIKGASGVGLALLGYGSLIVTFFAGIV